MAFADSLGAIGAVLNLREGTRTTTLESKTNFLGSARVGETITGEATPLQRRPPLERLADADHQRRRQAAGAGDADADDAGGPRPDHREKSTDRRWGPQEARTARFVPLLVVPLALAPAEGLHGPSRRVCGAIRRGPPGWATTGERQPRLNGARRRLRRPRLVTCSQATIARPVSNKPAPSQSTLWTSRSLTSSEASSGPIAPPVNCAAPLCTAARREGSASIVIGTRNGLRNRPVSPATALAETEQPAWNVLAEQPPDHQAARGGEQEDMEPADAAGHRRRRRAAGHLGG